MDFQTISRSAFFHAFAAMIVVAFALSISHKTVAQENGDSDIFLWYSDGNIQPYNLVSDEIGERLDFTFLSVEVLSNGTVFGLQSPNAFGFIPGEAEIIRLDLLNNEAATLYRGNNILSFALLPDNEQMVVVSFPVEIQSPTDIRSFSPNFLCLLSIQDEQCRNIDLPEDQYRIVWMDTERFLVYGQLNDNWFSLDVETLTPEHFPVQISADSTVDFGAVDEILVAQRGEDIFGYINTATGEFRPYDFSIDLPNPRASVVNLTFSPSNEYLLFKNGDAHYVLEMSSGSIVTQIEDELQNPQWLSDNQIIARYFPESGSLPQDIVLLNLGSNISETIASFEEEVFVIVPPQS